MKALGLTTLSVKFGRRTALGAAFGIAATLLAGQAAAEGKIRIAQQFGIPHPTPGCRSRPKTHRKIWQRSWRRH